MEEQNKYHNGTIYYLFDRKNNRIYVGSTCKAFKRRMNDHNYDFRAWKGECGNTIPRAYRTSFDILIQDEYEKGILEKFKCKSKRELEYRETEWIFAFKEKNVEVVNKLQPNKQATPIPLPLPCPS